MTCHPPSSTAPSRLVVRGVNWLGDAVMTLPALARLREALPETHIALLTDEKLGELWTGLPAVDSVITFSKNEGLCSTARRIRAGRFDAGLLLPNSPRSALQLWLAGVPRRVGGARPWRSCLLTDVIQPDNTIPVMRKKGTHIIHERLRAAPSGEGMVTPGGTARFRESYPAMAHQVFHYLRLATAFGANPTPITPALFLSAEERGPLTTTLLERAAPGTNAGSTWCGISPGAEYGPAKRWPAENFARVAAEVARQTGCQWLIFGGPKERAIGEEIRRHYPAAVNLCGQTTLRELMRGLARCRLLLTNDSGPMHLAAALGTPVTALFASTSPELTGPGLPGGESRHALLAADVPCSPCYQRECPVGYRCMSALSVEQVTAAVMRQISQPLR